MSRSKSSSFLSIVIVLALIMLMLPGCKAEPEVVVETVTETVVETVEVEKEAEPSEIAVIRFVTDETDPPSVEAFNKAIAQYESENPNVKIQLELVSGDNLIPYYATNIVGENAPDIGKTFESLTVEYINNDYVLPIDELINTMGGEDEFFEGSLFKWDDGHFYNLPYAGGGPVLYVRKDLFDENNVKLPETWDEWLDAAEKLTLDTDDDGTIDIYGTCIPAGKNRITETVILVLMWQNGNTMFDADLNPTIDNEGIINGLGFMKELAEFAPPGIGEYSFYEMIDSFTSGRVASSIYWGRMLAHLDSNAPDILEKTLAIPLPTNNLQMTWSSYDSYMIFKDSKYPEIAKDFLEFLVTGDRISEFLLTVPGHLLPATKTNAELESFWNNDFVVAQKDNIEVLYNVPNYGINTAKEAGAQVENGVLVPLEGMYNSVYPAIEAQSIIAQMVQKVIIENSSPEASAKWGQSEMERIISEQ